MQFVNAGDDLILLNTVQVKSKIQQVLEEIKASEFAHTFVKLSVLFAFATLLKKLQQKNA